jgi:hypothetical protein
VSLAIDGTSATALLLDRRSGTVLQPPKLYNESQVCPAPTYAHTSSSIYQQCVTKSTVGHGRCANSETRAPAMAKTISFQSSTF